MQEIVSLRKRYKKMTIQRKWEPVLCMIIFGNILVFILIFLITLKFIDRYLQAANAATLPSAAAVVSWRTSFVRQSPAAKIPGWDVIQSSDARINSISSRRTRPSKISFCGIWPIATKTPDTGIWKSSPVFFITQEQSFYHEFAFNIFDYGIQNKLYIVFFFQYVYQIAFPTEFIPAMYHIYFIAVIRKEFCILQSGISSTDHCYIFPAEKCAVTGRTIRDAGTGKRPYNAPEYPLQSHICPRKHSALKAQWAGGGGSRRYRRKSCWR